MTGKLLKIFLNIVVIGNLLFGSLWPYLAYSVPVYARDDLDSGGGGGYGGDDYGAGYYPPAEPSVPDVPAEPTAPNYLPDGSYDPGSQGTYEQVPTPAPVDNPSNYGNYGPTPLPAEPVYNQWPDSSGGNGGNQSSGDSQNSGGGTGNQGNQGSGSSCDNPRTLLEAMGCSQSAPTSGSYVPYQDSSEPTLPLPNVPTMIPPTPTPDNEEIFLKQKEKYSAKNLTAPTLTPALPTNYDEATGQWSYKPSPTPATVWNPKTKQWEWASTAAPAIDCSNPYRIQASDELSCRQLSSCQEGKVLNDCATSRCDTNIGKMVCQKEVQHILPNGGCYSGFESGSVTGESCSWEQARLTSLTCTDGQAVQYCAEKQCDSNGNEVCMKRVTDFTCQSHLEAGSSTGEKCQDLNPKSELKLKSCVSGQVIQSCKSKACDQASGKMMCIDIVLHSDCKGYEQTGGATSEVCGQALQTLLSPTPIKAVSQTIAPQPTTTPIPITYTTSVPTLVPPTPIPTAIPTRDYRQDQKASAPTKQPALTNGCSGIADEETQNRCLSGYINQARQDEIVKQQAEAQERSLKDSSSQGYSYYLDKTDSYGEGVTNALLNTARDLPKFTPGADKLDTNTSLDQASLDKLKLSQEEAKAQYEAAVAARLAAGSPEEVKSRMAEMLKMDPASTDEEVFIRFQKSAGLVGIDVQGDLNNYTVSLQSGANTSGTSSVVDTAKAGGNALWGAANFVTGGVVGALYDSVNFAVQEGGSTLKMREEAGLTGNAPTKYGPLGIFDKSAADAVNSLLEEVEADKTNRPDDSLTEEERQKRQDYESHLKQILSRAATVQGQVETASTFGLKGAYEKDVQAAQIRSEADQLMAETGLPITYVQGRSGHMVPGIKLTPEEQQIYLDFKEGDPAYSGYSEEQRAQLRAGKQYFELTKQADELAQEAGLEAVSGIVGVVGTVAGGSGLAHDIPQMAKGTAGVVKSAPKTISTLFKDIGEKGIGGVFNDVKGAVGSIFRRGDQEVGEAEQAAKGVRLGEIPEAPKVLEVPGEPKPVAEPVQGEIPAKPSVQPDLDIDNPRLVIKDNTAQYIYTGSDEPITKTVYTDYRVAVNILADQQKLASQAQQDLLEIASQGSLDGNKILGRPLGGYETYAPDIVSQRRTVMAVYTEDPDLARKIVADDATFAHGSSSASLPGVLDMGLKPRKYLEGQGAVVSSGEGIFGAANLNQEYVSFAPVWEADAWGNYAKAGKAVTVESLEENIQALQEFLVENPNSPLADSVREVMGNYRKTQDLLKANPPGVSLQVDLTRENFPVAYLAKSGDVRSRQAAKFMSEEVIPTQFPNELAVKGGVNPEDISVILVPRDKVSSVKALVKSKGRNDIVVSALEDFKDSVSTFETSTNKLAIQENTLTSKVKYKVTDIWDDTAGKLFRREKTPSSVEPVVEQVAQPGGNLLNQAKNTVSDAGQAVGAKVSHVVSTVVDDIGKFFGGGQPSVKLPVATKQPVTPSKPVSIKEALNNGRPIAIVPKVTSNTKVQLAKLDRVSDAFQKGQASNKEVVAYWRGLARDTEGRWIKYKETTPYFRGQQTIPNLSNDTVRNYIQHSIEQERSFLQALDNGSYKGNFQDWIKDMQAKQYYKGQGDEGVINEVGGQLRSAGHDAVVRGDVIPLARKYGDPYKIGGVQVLKLPGISESGLPYDISQGRRVVHFYPTAAYYDEYLAMMEPKLEQAAKLTAKGPSKGALEAIASYYQYGLNSRMFKEVNQSLFTNQANAMLKRMGMEPIEQGILDFVAMRLQPENFSKYFIDEVKRVNPRLAEKLSYSSQTKSVNLASTSQQPTQQNLLEKLFAIGMAYAEGQSSNQVDVQDHQVFESDVKNNFLQDKLLQEGQLDSTYIKEVISSDMLRPIFEDSAEGYALTTGKLGSAEGDIDREKYIISVDPLEGVDITVPAFVEASKNTKLLVPVGIKEGSGKVVKSKTVASEKHDKFTVLAQDNSGQSPSTHITIAVFKDNNGNGQFDGNDSLLPWAGVKVKLTRVNQKQDVFLLAGWNLITLTALPEVPVTASFLIKAINFQGGQAVTVSALEHGAWQSFVMREGKEYSGDDFTIEPGKGYFVKALKPSVFTFTGQNFVSPVKLNLEKGWNTVGVPYSAQTYKISNLLTKTNNSENGLGSRWESGLWDSFLQKKGQKYGEDFLIEPSRGYVVKLDKGGAVSP